MIPTVTRRRFLSAGGFFLTSFAGVSAGKAAPEDESRTRRVFKAVKFGMLQEKLSLAEGFRILREAGFDGVELDSPGGVNKTDAYLASRRAALSVHGMVDSVHWNLRLSDPDPDVRDRGRAGLKVALEEAFVAGGNTVVLVPGRVTDPSRENQYQVWRRSIDEIRKVLPIAARLGIRILIANAGNGFCYDPTGPDDQPASLLAAYLDEIGSPWVGACFDPGNLRKFSRPQDWIRALGSRVVKLNCKDWSKAKGFCDIGDGDVDWPEVRRALRDVGFTGWATAEVPGGDRDRMREISLSLDNHLLKL